VDFPFDGAKSWGSAGGGGVLRDAAERGGVRREPGIDGVRLAAYGNNRNRIVRGDSFVTRGDGQVTQPGSHGAAQGAGGGQARGSWTGTLWLAAVGELTADVAEPIARIAAAGGVLIADGVSPRFFQAVAYCGQTARNWPPSERCLTTSSKAPTKAGRSPARRFGAAPAKGTLPGQQRVSGFAGRGLVNTFVQGDGPQGTATSKKFRIARRYNRFLIGGGDHRNQTCINLVVEGKVVRTAVGRNNEELLPASWDVGDLQGKEAVIEIVDRNSSPWGHINIDRILFCDLPPEPFLGQGPFMSWPPRPSRCLASKRSPARFRPPSLSSSRNTRRPP